MIDLHSHTVCSDGSFTPSELIEEARKIGLNVLSITDHNTIDAYSDPQLAEHLKDFEGDLLPGVEITCMFEGEVVEVLGYGFDLERMSQILPDHVLSFEDKQKKECELIAEAFTRAGARFDRSQIVYNPEKESSRKAFLKELLRWPENRSLFLDPDSMNSSRRFTRHEIYNPQSPLYVDEQSLYPSVAEAADLIHEAGGIALLAHLYEYSNADELFDRMETIVSDCHLDGLECRHSCFTPEQSAGLEQFCQSHHLLKSGGSDFHGTRKPGILLGNRQSMTVPKNYMENWPESCLDRML